MSVPARLFVIENPEVVCTVLASEDGKHRWAKLHANRLAALDHTLREGLIDDADADVIQSSQEPLEHWRSVPALNPKLLEAKGWHPFSADMD